MSVREPVHPLPFAEDLKTILSHGSIPWLVLAFSLFLTGLGWVVLDSYQRQKALLTFEYETDSFREALSRRLAIYESVLMSARGLFAASKSVEREEWHAFVDMLDVDIRYPGTHSLGYALLVPLADKAAHIEAIRGQGFPDYDIRPPGDRSVYGSIIYTEPPTERNIRAIGFDMFSHPVRRKAMEDARDMSGANISGKVILNQEPAQGAQPGFLMYMPVYKNGRAIASMEDRRAAVEGWVYCAFRMGDFMGRFLEDHVEKGSAFRIYDGPNMNQEDVFYTSPDYPGLATLPARKVLRRTLGLDFGAHTWTVVFMSRKTFEPFGKNYVLTVELLGGLLISLLLFGMIRGISGAQKTAQLLAERMTIELRENEERWQLAIRGNNDGIWDWNVRTDEVFFSPRWKSMLGYEDQEIENKLEEWKSRVHPDDLPNVLKVIQAHFEKILPYYTSEHRVRCKDGSYKWILDRGQAMWDADGKPVRMAGSHTDIDQRKRSEQRQEMQYAIVTLLSELKPVRETVPRVLELLTTRIGWEYAGLWLLDQEVNLMRFDSYWYSPEKDYQKLVANSQEVAFSPGVGLIGRVWSSKNIVQLSSLGDQMLFRRAQPAMEVGLFSVIGVPLHAGGEVIGVVEFFDRQEIVMESDLRKGLEAVAAQLAQYVLRKRDEEKVRDAIRVKTEFVGMVSHELRTPLTVVKGGIDVVLDEIVGSINSEQKDMLLTVKRNIDRLNRLINDVLDYQKLESGRMSFEMKDNDISRIVRDTTADFAMEAKSKGIDLRCEVPAEVLQVHCDKDKIIQVLVNLLNNAFRFSEKGTITVRAGLDKDAAFIAVQDEGIGIRMEDIPQLFQAFSQLSSGPDRKTGGSGLGLSIVKKIVERHGGRVNVHSVFGKGSTFTLWVPVKRKAVS